MPNRKRTLITSIALIAAVFLAYCSVRHFDFVYYDDPTHVFGNDRVNKGLSVDNIRWAFGGFNGAQWIPLTWISFMTDISLFGLNPGPMHVVNVLLHALNAVLLFLLVRRMTSEFWPSAMVAAVFALHPVNVESVAWVTERKNVLSTAFWLLSTLSYVRYTESRRVAWMAGSVALMACGLMVKAMLVTLPCTLLLLDAWPLDRLRTTPWKRLILEKAPLFALSALGSYLQMRAAVSDGLLWEGGDAPSGFYRAMNAGANVLIYLRMIFVPMEYAPMLPLPKSAPVLLGSLGWGFVVAAIALGWRLRKTAPYFLMGLLWFLGTQVPVSGIVGAGDAVRCDRYLYVPQIGIIIAAVWAMKMVAQKLNRDATASIAAVILGGLGALTFVTTGHWQNSATLFLHCAAISPESIVAQKLAGWEMARNGRLQDSFDYYTASLLLGPDNSEARCSRAIVLGRMGRTVEAIAEFRAVLAKDPAYADAKLNLGMQLFATGAVAESRATLESMKDPGPREATLSYWLARVADAEKRRDDALNLYAKALSLARDETWTSDAVARVKLLR